MYTLITGATGFLGGSLIKRISGDIRVMSRNEGKLLELKQKYPHVEIITGDIADEISVAKALDGVDSVFHLAAFKHVGLAETHPYQCTNSNVVGTLNLLKYFKKGLFVGISTDKAAQVAGVYGASKLLMERSIYEYSNIRPEVKYITVRYGNILYSTGSVLVKWKDALINGKEIIVTDPSATRFFWTVEQAVDLIFDAIEKAPSAKPYCPEMKSIKVSDLLEAMQIKYGRAAKITTIGLQPGENMHERILEDGKDSSEVEMFTIDEIIKMI